MVRKHIMFNNFNEAFVKALERIALLSVFKPDLKILKVTEFVHKFDEQFRKDLFEQIWNNRLREYLVRRIKEEINKVNYKGQDYWSWKKDFMMLNKYENPADNIGFDKIGKMDKLKEFIDFHKFAKIYDDSTKRLLSDYLKEASLANKLGALVGRGSMKDKTDGIISVAASIQSSIQNVLAIPMTPTPTLTPMSAGANQLTAFSTAVKKIKMDNLGLGSSPRTHLTKNPILERVKNNFIQRAPGMDLTFTEKNMNILVLACMEYILNKEGVAF